MAKHNREEIGEKINAVCRDSGVVFAYLFGSQAKGSTGPLSDIDIALYIGGLDRKEYSGKKLELLGRLNDALKTDEIDLVLLNNASPFLAQRILRDGKLIYCADEKLRLDYEQITILKYLDWKPYLDKYTRQAIKDG
ncbi:MAG: nucleotidyltransferase domain-containing protein [Candidatus Omnitrophota bacterium]